MKLNDAIQLCRTQKNMKQSELAKLAGISVSYLSLIERGKRNPNLSTIEKIAGALGISILTLTFLGATEDGLEEIDLELAQRLKAYAFNQVIRGN